MAAEPVYFVLLCGCLFAVSPAATASQCLPEAVLNLQKVTISGRQMPLGLWMFEWESSRLVSEIFRILAEEVLGYEVRVGTGVASWTGLRALAGCADPTEVGPCLAGVPEFHLCLEVWYWDHDGPTRLALQRIAHELGRRDAPKLIGQTGYVGVEGMFVPGRVLGRALGTGVALDYYRLYNSSLGQTHKYFDSMSNIHGLLSCADMTDLLSSADLHAYVLQTNDFDAVSQSGGMLKLRCWEDSWFLAPACRASPGTCIPLITSGSAWRMLEMMQQAFWHTMPLALASAKNVTTDYKRIPSKNDVLFYWWFPDATHLSLQADMVAFPTHDVVEWLNGTFRTAFYPEQLYKIEADALATIAPAARTLASNLRLSSDQITQIMRGSLKSVGSSRDIACRWLLEYRSVWKKWLPDPLTCEEGTGLVDLNGTFLNSTSAGSKCRECMPGQSSVFAATESTRFCVPCPAGKSSNSFKTSGDCNACEPGKFSGVSGMTHCLRCPAGQFQNSSGQTTCDRCPASFDTHYEGTEHVFECRCPPGTLFDQAADICVGCPTHGVACPGGYAFGSSRADTTPRIVDGFMSLPDEPLSMYTCTKGTAACKGPRSPFLQSLAPGDAAAAICGQGWALLPRCSRCEDSHFPARDGSCAKCAAQEFHEIAFRLLALGCFNLFGVVWLYFRANRPNPAGMIILASVFRFLQVLQSIDQLNLDWPASLDGFFALMRGVSLLSFDLNLFDDVLSLRFECVAGSGALAFLLRDALLPLGLIPMFGLLALLAHLVHRPLKWAHVANVVGAVLSGVFVSISRMSLTLFAADEMPNGRLMTKRFPELEVGGEAWSQLLPFGVASCVLYCVGFFTYVCHAVMRAPRLAAQDPNFIQQYRFAFGATRPECWWWILVSLAYGFGVVAVHAISSDHRVSLYTCFLIVLFMTCLQIFVHPYKFRSCNDTDCALKCSLAVTLVLAASFVPQADHEAQEWASFTFGVISLACIALAVLLAMYNFSNWTHSIIQPSGSAMGKAIERVILCRDVFAAVSLMKEQELMQKLSNMCDYDLVQLENTAMMLVASVLGQQPGPRLHQQRIMPGVKFHIFDPLETEHEVLKAAIGSRLTETVKQNATFRLNLRTMVHELSQETAPRRILGRSGAVFFSTSNQIKQLLDDMKHRVDARAEFGSAEHTLARNLRLSRRRMISAEDFARDISTRTSLTKEDALEIFRVMDTGQDGFVSIGEFTALLKGLASEEKRLRSVQPADYAEETAASIEEPSGEPEETSETHDPAEEDNDRDLQDILSI